MIDQQGPAALLPGARDAARRFRDAFQVCLFASAFFLTSLPAFSQAVRVDAVETALVAEVSSIRPGTPFVVGVRFRMDPDWHIYWKNPGDTGLPTTVAWNLPPGFTAGPLQWPAPERIVAQGIASYGYTATVTLLATVSPPRSLRPGSVAMIKARVGWLACRIECTPGRADVALALPVSSAVPRPDPRWAADFSQARARLPVTPPPGAVKAWRAGGRIILTADGLQPPPASRAVFLAESPGLISDSAAQEARVAGGAITLSLAPPGPDSPAPPGPADRLRGVLLVSSAGFSRGYDIDAAFAAPADAAGAAARSAGSPVSGAALGLLAALGLAFIGGLILNLMPCVLPVVSLKVLAFVRHSHEGGGNALRQGLLFAGGVLVSFWAIAGILLALRAGGGLIGWGFQFQSPVIVTITAALFFLIALNLFGVFEIGSALPRAAGAAARARGNAGSFLNGLMATAVATPCTAPFMAGALGFALSRPPVEGLAVFTSLAVGMAAPYVVLAALPGLLRRIPRPGPWMVTLRQVLAFPMLGAVIWMLWVLQTLAGLSAMPVALSMLLAAALGAWIYGRWGAAARSARSRLIAGALATALIVGGTAVGAARTAAASPAPARSAAEPSSSSSWEPWSPDRQASLRAQGAAVFVDFSARWCLTCQVNEKVALDNPSVVKRFRELNVATLRADWTDRNDAIARELASFGRAGVPLYVLYPAGSADPVVLPELLTPGIVLQALNGSGGPPR